MTEGERSIWIAYCEKIAINEGLEYGDFSELSDAELTEMSDKLFAISIGYTEEANAD